MDEGDIRPNGIALIVTGIVDCSKAEVDPVEIANVVLGTVRPSFNKEDIISGRQAPPPPPPPPPSPHYDRSLRVDAENTDNSTNAPEVTIDRPEPQIIRLINRSKVEDLIIAKSSFTRLKTPDIDPTRLSEKLVKNVYHTNILYK